LKLIEPVIGRFRAVARLVPIYRRRLLALLLATGIASSASAFAAGHPSEAPDNRNTISGMWLLPSTEYMQTQSLPLTPAAKKARDALLARMRSGQVLSDNSRLCLPPGVPGLMLNEFALEILESPGVVAILSEESPLPRLVHIDEKQLPDDVMPTWNGHSVGHWENDVLVVETTAFNDRISRLPVPGGLPSPNAKITEHISLQDHGETLADAMTFEDPVNLTKPWSHTWTYQRLPAGSELWEYPCEVNAPGWKDRFAGETESK